LKPEWWGSPLVQEEKYQEKPVKREEEIMMIMMMMMMIIIIIIINSCTRSIAHYKGSATIRNLKPEWLGSPLVQEEKYQEKPVKR
jgi:truncated hemoglobin YjbI